MLGEEQLQRVGRRQGQDSIRVCQASPGLYWNVRGLSWRGSGGGGGTEESSGSLPPPALLGL